MSDLDDYDLDKEPDALPPDDGGSSRLRARLVAATLLVLVGLLAIVYVARRDWRAKPSVESPPPPEVLATPSPPPSPEVALPSLNASDAFVRGLARGLSADPLLAVWLANKALIRTFTAVVENIADGETPAPHLRFLAPKQGFRATARRGQQLVDPRSYQGYDPFATAIASLDAPACARVYRLLEPLFDAAYRDLGHPEGGFAKTLDRAMAALLDVPVLPADVRVVPVVRAVVVYEYADKRLEALTPAQKQLLRIGPANVTKVQAKLRELRQALKAQAGSRP